MVVPSLLRSLQSFSLDTSILFFLAVFLSNFVEVKRLTLYINVNLDFSSLTLITLYSDYETPVLFGKLLCCLGIWSNKLKRRIERRR